ncbi:MAG TPA: hypothetical protein DCK95_03730 [Anaerolineaceae bacterium]|nr:hypothetical protein [Anaerolineaceae bacterium]
MGSLLDLLKNKIDITSVPFSYPGSRLAIYTYSGASKLYLNLSERLINFFPGIESYTNRLPFLEEMTFIDADQKPLTFQVTTQPHALDFTTSLGAIQLTFLDETTLCFHLPDKTSIGLRFNVNALEWSPDKTGGVITSYRFAQYASNAKVLINQLTKGDVYSELTLLVQTEQNACLVLSIGEDIKTPLSCPSHDQARHNAWQIWEEWFNKAPEVEEIYQPTYAYAWWTLVNNMFNPKGNLQYNVFAPSKKNYVGIWLWDNALHAVALRHIDPQLARDQIRAFLAHQQPDGMLPDAIFDDGIVTEIDHPMRAKVTKPPLLAWAALKIHALDPDINFLSEIYQPLVRWNRWWFQENDDDRDGFVQYNHPFSSGMDDNPTWDSGVPVESPDINTYLYIQMKSLAFIAQAIGKSEESDNWEIRAANLLDTIICCSWDESRTCFKAMHQKKSIPVFTPLNLYPLWTGALPNEMNKKIIAHIKNTDEFYGKLMLPSVARNDPKFDPDRMWRGPVWANINYFFIEALAQIGEYDLARDLRTKTLALIMQNDGIYEYYNAETGKPGSKAAPAFGWTAAVYIDLAIQASRDPMQ